MNCASYTSDIDNLLLWRQRCKAARVQGLFEEDFIFLLFQYKK